MHVVRISIVATVVSALLTATAAGQSAAPTTSSTGPYVSSTLTAQTLADLPLGDNLYSALETMESEVIADRFNSSGLNAGEGGRVGGFLGSWSQTLFRIGDVEISDPAGSGAALVFPDILFWRQADVFAGPMPIDVNTSGLATIFEPRRPTTSWSTVAAASGSGGGLASSTPSGPVPPVARLHDFGHGGLLTSGPLSDRLGIVAGATWAKGSKFMRERGPAANSDVESGFLHLVYTPTQGIESRTVGLVQRAEVPFEYRHLFQPDAATRDKTLHLQSTLERSAADGLKWRLYGGGTMRSRSNHTGRPAALAAERLVDGPIASIVAATGDATTARWTLGARLAKAATRGTVRHHAQGGLTVDGATLRTADQFIGSIGELVDNEPARLWSFTHPDRESRRRATAVAVFAGDRVFLSPTVTLDAGIRFESIAGSARGAAVNVTWNTWLPNAMIQWAFANNARGTLVGGYRRSANRLNLDLLSFGDPAGPTAVVARWLTDPVAAPLLGAVIDRVGPGTGGDPGFSRLDPDVKRPYTDEFVIGVESLRRGWLRTGLMGIARRQANLIGVLDVGVPVASYSTVGIPDPGHDFVGAEDDQILVAYNRLPSSYGRNQYLLTNPAHPAATAYALKLFAEGTTDRWFVLFGATASAAQGSAGHRGYGPLENDQDVAGDLFTNPNATTFARGRLFSDRAFTIKWTTIYRFPQDVRVGAIARYQDGQPFARLVIAPDLNQGPETVRAYPNGGNRFTFTGTLDIRVQKGFTVGRTHLDGIVDFYNLATRSNEVEEYVVTGPSFRTPTFTEPTRAVHLGVRVTF